MTNVNDTKAQRQQARMNDKQLHQTTKWLRQVTRATSYITEKVHEFFKSTIQTCSLSLGVKETLSFKACKVD